MRTLRLVAIVGGFLLAAGIVSYIAGARLGRAEGNSVVAVGLRTGSYNGQTVLVGIRDDAVSAAILTDIDEDASMYPVRTAREDGTTIHYIVQRIDKDNTSVVWIECDDLGSGYAVIGGKKFDLGQGRYFLVQYDKAKDRNGFPEITQLKNRKLWNGTGQKRPDTALQVVESLRASFQEVESFYKKGTGTR